jgi:DNA-binding NarL/FixJ family response regulator
MTCYEALQTNLRVLAVDDHPLTIDGLRLSLESIDPGTQLRAVGKMEEAFSLCSGEADFSLLLLELEIDRPKAFDLISLVRQQRPSLPIVVLSAEDSVTSIRSAFDAGVAGYLSKRSTREVIVGALYLVLMGGTYIPPSLLADVRKSDVPGTGFKLTARESEVLSLVALGLSNKLISRKLAISESTTKTHVSSIMRVLQVTNRTQVSALVGRLKQPMAG